LTTLPALLIAAIRVLLLLLAGLVLTAALLLAAWIGLLLTAALRIVLVLVRIHPPSQRPKKRNVPGEFKFPKGTSFSELLRSGRPSYTCL